MNSKYVKNLNSALIGAVIDAVSRKLPSDLKLPSDFRPFLAGEDPRLPGGILGQLCIYVALHLKTDTRAQVAVLHLTLQDCLGRLDRHETGPTTDLRTCAERKLRVRRINLKRFCSLPLKTRLRTYRPISKLSSMKLSNHSIRPQLDRPFANASADTLASFTYTRFRTTPMFGREAAKDALLQFLGDPRPALWTVISGPARHWEKPHCSRTDRHGPNSNSRLSKGTHRLLAGRILEKPLMDQGRRTQVESGCRHIDSHRLCGPTRPKGSCHFPSRP